MILVIGDDHTLQSDWKSYKARVRAGLTVYSGSVIIDI